jgi:hypothetical protein
MNSIISDKAQEYKVCAGKDCKNTAIARLKIKYIHKTGDFCESCTEYLLQNELAIKRDDCAL